MAKLVDAQDLKSCGSQIPCQFKSGLRHQWRNTQVWLKGPVLKTGRSETARGFESLFLRHLFFSYISRSGAVVARWAHNPKVVGSNPSSATKWSRGVVVITSACHAEDREFKSRRDRHFFWLCSSVGRARD